MEDGQNDGYPLTINGVIWFANLLGNEHVGHFALERGRFRVEICSIMTTLHS